MLANDWAQLFTWWCDQDSAYQDSQVFLYERYKSACSSHSLQIFLNPKLMAKQKPQSLLWAWCRNDCFCKLCLHKPTGICMEVHPLRLNLIWLPIAKDLNVGNQWANVGTANSSHEDMGERTLLWKMGTSHQRIGDRVTGNYGKEHKSTPLWSKSLQYSD